MRLICDHNRWKELPDNCITGVREANGASVLGDWRVRCLVEGNYSVLCIFYM